MLKIMRNIQVPTGNILVAENPDTKRKVEFLSIGDYGKDVNLKCDAMGLTREIEKVEHMEMMPLEKKWVITISTQHGCSMGCKFCDVPKVGPGVNVSYEDLVDQVQMGISMHPEVRSSERLNIHFARLGEPSWNPQVLNATIHFKKYVDPVFKIHPVISTMMPKKNANLLNFLSEWMWIKNQILNGEAGLQLSINSTNDLEREEMFNGNSHSLATIGSIMRTVVSEKNPPVGRKITLNFALAGYEIDPDVLLRHFDPRWYVTKITPMHRTDRALKNGIETDGDYTTFEPYRDVEDRLKKAGYDVLVFIASKEEDEGRITCGNAILSGTMPLCDHKEI